VSNSALDLQTITASPIPVAFQNVQDGLCNRFDFSARVNIPQSAVIPEIFNQRFRLAIKSCKAPTDYAFGIVLPLKQCAAIVVTDSRHTRRTIVNMINASADLAHPASCKPPDETAAIHNEVDYERSAVAQSDECSAQLLSLRKGSGKTIQNKSTETIRPDEPFFDHAENDFVGHQIAAIHNRLRAAAEFRSVHDVFAEHIARGKMLDAMAAGNLLGLRSLTGTRRPKKNYGLTCAHFDFAPSFIHTAGLAACPSLRNHRSFA
jgi:hypothetical protein